MGALLLISHPRSAIPAANLVKVHKFCISLKAYHTHTTHRKANLYMLIYTAGCWLIRTRWWIHTRWTYHVPTHARSRQPGSTGYAQRGWNKRRGSRIGAQHWRRCEKSSTGLEGNRALKDIVRIFELNRFCRTRRDRKGKVKESVQTWRKGKTASEATMRLRIGARSWSMSLYVTMCSRIRQVFMFSKQFSRI